jgi:hypothetical protein
MCAGISSHMHGCLEANNKNKEYHIVLAFYLVVTTRKAHWGIVWGKKLNTILTFLRISGAVPPLRHMPSWCAKGLHYFISIKSIGVVKSEKIRWGNVGFVGGTEVEVSFGGGEGET